MARKKKTEKVEVREDNFFDKLANFIGSVALVSSAVGDAVDAFEDVEKEWEKYKEKDEDDD